MITDFDNDYRVCSKEHPMPNQDGGRWLHLEAHEVGDQLDGCPGGDIVKMKCDNCGKEWWKELPQ